MSHIELRAVTEHDHDAIFAMMHDPEGVQLTAFAADDPGDREAFDEWIAAELASDTVDYLAVTDAGDFAGTAALFTVDGDRELSFWLARHAWGRGVATEAVRLLIAREPIRPLYARVAAESTAALKALEHAGFTEVSRTPVFAPSVSREVDEVLLTLPPNLDGY